MFFVFEQKLLPRYSGRTFANVVQKGDYDAEANASVPLEVLARALVRFVADEYHNRPHGGLGGETLRNAWRRIVGQTGRIPVPDRDTRRAIFGVETPCTLDNSGVTVLGLRYQNRELFEHFTAKGASTVDVRLDHEDVGDASVRLGDDWVIVPCRTAGLRGVSLRAWKEAAFDLRERYRDEAAMSRPVVLAAVADLDDDARECRLAAGIAEELETPESLQAARERLGLGFALPEWDDLEPDFDPLGDVIPVPGAKAAPDADDDVAPPPAASRPSTWSMGDRTEGE